MPSKYENKTRQVSHLTFLLFIQLIIGVFWFKPEIANATSFDWTASIVVGQPGFTSNTANNGGISAHSLSGPTSVSTDGTRLFTSEAGNKRLLIFDPLPTSSNPDASLVLGQDNFATNATRTLGPTSFPLPYGMSSDGTRLYLGDYNNRRVLIWNTIPIANDVAPDVVLGQPDFYTNTLYAAGATTIGGPFSVFSDGTHLFSSDAAAKRILIWNSIPTTNNAAADVVIGQANLVTSSVQPNSCAALGTGPSGNGASDVYSLYSDGTHLFVADYFANRVLIWNSIPTTSGTAADVVLGQPDCTSKTANNGGLSASSMRGPTSAWSDGVRLFVADYVNNRILVWDSIPTTNNVEADSVIGQPNATSSTANNGGISANSLYNPFVLSGVASSTGNILSVAEYANNRVLIYYYPATFDLSSPADDTSVYTNSPTFTWQASTDDNAGLSKYQLYIDGVLDTDNIASTATSIQPTVVLGNGSHTWQVKAVNAEGNTTWSTSTFNITVNTEWVKSDSNPILEPGPTGSWDESAVIDPSVIKEPDGTYKMWYLGWNAAGTHAIGLATSSDGVSWTKYSGNPIMPSGGVGDWDEYLWEARVTRDGDVYKMWYQGATAYNAPFKTGYATSSDGINWTKYSGNPVLSGEAGEWDEDYVGFRNVIKRDGVYHAWYEATESQYSPLINFRVGYASSSDGINWTKSANNPVLQGDSGEWDDESIIPNVVLVNGVYQMYYSVNYGPPSLVGLATSSDGVSWTKSTSNPVINLRGLDDEWDSTRGELVSIVQTNISGDFLGYYRAPNPNNSDKWSIGVISNLVFDTDTARGSVTLSVDPFPNDNVGSAGYYFYRTDDASRNSGWIQSRNWTDTGLTCNTVYNYAVKFRNSSGVEAGGDIIAKRTDHCVSEKGSFDAPRPPDLPGSPGLEMEPDERPVPPSTSKYNPQGGFNVLINGGAEYTNRREVKLKLFAGWNTKYMMISDSVDYTGAVQEIYKEDKTWTLSKGDGEKAIYAKFLTLYDVASTPVSASIILDTKSPDAPIVTAPNNDAIIYDNTPTVAGTAEPKSSITIELDGEAYNSIADEHGDWYYTILTPLPEGEYALKVTAQDKATNLSKPSIVNFKIKKPGEIPPTKLEEEPIVTPELPVVVPPVEPEEPSVPEEQPAEPEETPTEEKQSSIPPTELPTNTLVFMSLYGNLNLTPASLEQPLQVVSGQSFHAFVQPGKPVKAVTVNVIFEKPRGKDISYESKHNLLSALFGIPQAKAQTWQIVEFTLIDDDKDGIWQGDITVPLTTGEYIIRATLFYQDNTIKTLDTQTLIDPRGYVYTKEKDGLEKRVKDAIISLFIFDEGSGEFKLWDAQRYGQQNPETTDKTGEYEFLVPEGRYTIEVTAQDHHPYRSEEFAVKEGDVIRQNLELTPKWQFDLKYLAGILILVIGIAVGIVIGLKKKAL